MDQNRSQSLLRKFDQTSPDDLGLRRQKRMKLLEGIMGSSSNSYISRAELRYRNQKNDPKVKNYPNPFSMPNLMEELERDKGGRYGSVTKDIKDLCARKWEIIKPLCEMYPSVRSPSVYSSHLQQNMEVNSLEMRQRNYEASKDIIDLDDDCEKNDTSLLPAEEMEKCVAENVTYMPGGISYIERKRKPDVYNGSNNPVVIIDADEEDGGKLSGGCDSYDLEVRKMRRDSSFGHLVSNSDLQQASKLPVYKHVELTKDKSLTSNTDSLRNMSLEAVHNTSSDLQEVVVKRPVGANPIRDLIESDIRNSKVTKEENKNIVVEVPPEKSKGVYVGIQDDEMSESNSALSGDDDGLCDIWRDMNLALECSKDACLENASVELNPLEEDVEECDHSFVLKDDLGHVCRVCGLIEKSIETIFEFQWGKGTKTSTRQYMSLSRNSKDSEVEEKPFSVTALERDFGGAEIAVHPRHMKQMKAHQLEGFNFLVRNLISDNPGGCILAHAPGSGKTFMVISFMQGFLTKYPNARPLIVLPKGILGTWKKEFERWQVEEVKLYDLYSSRADSRADSRAQQLEVLKQWVEHKGILFLGYTQFANIVSNSASSEAAASCHDILVRVPSILILDEGHTPRNEGTDVLASLAKVETPRKVVLSGTLFQNHVKEVFNILNLVRPKFLKMPTSKTLVTRIMSMVQISGGRKLKSGTESSFFDLVEDTLRNDQDFRRKGAVIQALREMTSKVLHYYKGDYLDELPGLVDLTVGLSLSPKQKHAVDKLRSLDKFTQSSMGSAVYVHPQLREFSEKSRAGERRCNINEDKMDELIGKVDAREGVKTKFFLNLLGLCESGGEKLLVFSQYLLPLKFLERLVTKIKGWSVKKEIFVISGDTSQEEREQSMEQFNNSPDAKIFFGSIKACGEGISLVGASRLIILDIHLNPSVTRQAIGRAFRPGQTKKVYVYRLVAADSPEEEDHDACFRKELISKMWFEWSEFCGYKDYEMEEVDMKDIGDPFWDSPFLGKDVKSLHRR